MVRQTGMKRLQPILAASSIVLAVAGCSAAAARPPVRASDQSVAEVTGFTSESSAWSLYGPVSVRATGAQASRLALLVNQLPSAARPECQEPAGLIYRIVFGAGSVAHSKTVVVEGYRCGAAVAVGAAGSASYWRRDSACKLFRAVRRILSGRAKATQDLTPGCVLIKAASVEPP